MADDLPPSTVFVHLERGDRRVFYVPGRIELTGVLDVGNQSEPNGRVSTVRLLLDAALTQEFLGDHQKRQASR